MKRTKRKTNAIHVPAAHNQVAPGDAADRQRVLFWYMEDGERRPMSVQMYRFIGQVWPKIATDEDRARFVTDCRKLIQESKVANRRGADIKQFSDEARVLLHEVPRADSIPKDGFPSEEKIKFPDCFSVQEIECRLKAELERVGLKRWFELLEGDSNI